MPPRPIIILGPTAGGKSAFAVALAETLPGRAEILGADSMQVYRHMNAATAKPEPELRARVPHHLIDIVEPTERFTVADWLERAEPLIEGLQNQSVRPIIVGGTNLYFKALLEGMFEGPERDASFRASVADVPPQELHRRLAAVDADAAQRIHPNDHKKLVRALEVYHLTGMPISHFQSQWSEWPGAAESGAPRAGGPYRHDPILIGLDWPVDLINRRINARVKRMFFPAVEEATHPCDQPLLSGHGEGIHHAETLPEETRRLEAAGLLGPQARQALGYKQVLDYLAGSCTLDEAFEKTKILTRRFAKTQRNWLKRFRGVHWLSGPEKSPEAIAIEAEAIVRSYNSDG